MKKLICAAMLALSATAFADPQAMITKNEETGQSVTLTKNKGVCVDDAMEAIYADKKGKILKGCWVILEAEKPFVQIAWLNGYKDIIAVGAFTPQEEM